MVGEIVLAFITDFEVAKKITALMERNYKDVVFSFLSKGGQYHILVEGDIVNLTELQHFAAGAYAVYKSMCCR